MQETQCAAAWLGLTDKVCVVTGAGRGIGAQTAQRLAAADAKVALLDRDADTVTETAAQITRQYGRGRIIALAVDVADADAVRAAGLRVAQTLGACQVLINNAAIRRPGSLLTLSPQDWHAVLAVNLTAAWLCSQTFAQQMIDAKQGGSIVHVGSITGHHPFPHAGNYSITKAALGMLSSQLALELAHASIRSNVVTPGMIHTPATDAAYADPQLAAARARLVPRGRIGAPADLADAILFLASDRADYITGQDLIVDGGMNRSLMRNIPRPEPQ